jgi:mevalonate kinase
MDARSEGRAFGKLILLGEHAVVYGAPALAAGIALHCHATAEATASGRTLRLHDQTCAADAAGDDLAKAFEALLAERPAPGHVAITVGGDLPAGVGLGFSATAAVAIARAVGALAGDAGDDAVRARAMAWERVFHGNPSGVDVAAAMRGGVTRFQRHEGRDPEIRAIEVGAPFSLCVGLTGTRSSTRDMVSGLAALGRAQPELLRRSVDGIAVVVDNGVTAVEKGDARALGELMDMNQMLLAGLMLSTEALELLCQSAREAGALGAKLTGSGGGGAMVALAGVGEEGDRAGERILAAWRGHGYQGFSTRLGR